jgi:four helix bundle protein
MFLNLNHRKLDIYQASQMFVIKCYKLTNQLPSEEKFGMISKIRRPAVSVHLNLAEGVSRKSDVERTRSFEITGSLVVEIDAALDVANQVGYLVNIDTEPLAKAMLNCLKMLT